MLSLSLFVLLLLLVVVVVDRHSGRPILYTYREREREREIFIYICMYVYIYIYIYICMCMCVYIYIYIYIYYTPPPRGGGVQKLLSQLCYGRSLKSHFQEVVVHRISQLSGVTLTQTHTHKDFANIVVRNNVTSIMFTKSLWVWFWVSVAPLISARNGNRQSGKAYQ